MTVTVTATPTFGVGVPPAVLLTVTATGIPANSALAVWRIHPDGTEHLVITTDAPRLIPDAWVGLDYHCPFNAVITYRVEAAGQTGTTDTVVTGNATWLISPSDPDLSVRVNVRNIEARSQDSRAGRFAPYGGKATFRSEGLRNGISGSITVEVGDDRPIRRLLDEDSVILINTPGQGWRISWMWVQPGQVSYLNPGRARWPFEIVTLPFEESADPDVDQTPLWTCDIAAAVFAAEGVDCDELPGLYATCLDLAINRRS